MSDPRELVLRHAEVSWESPRMGPDVYRIKRVPKIIWNRQIIGKHRVEGEAREQESGGKEVRARLEGWLGG